MIEKLKTHSVSEILDLGCMESPMYRNEKLPDIPEIMSKVNEIITYLNNLEIENNKQKENKMEVDKAVIILEEYICIWKGRSNWDEDKPYFGLGQLQALETLLNDRKVRDKIEGVN